MADNYIISTIFKIIDEATDPVRKIGRSLGGLSEGMSKMSSKLAASGKKMQTFGKDMSGVGTDLSMKLTAPFLLIGGYSLKAASDMESLTTSFETMMGSAEGAKNMMEELVKFANATPYELDEVANAARSLMAAGVGPEEITKKLTLLGDIASTAKIPLDELVRVYDKMKNKGKASLEELNPIAEKGIPIFQALADTMGVTKDQVFDMASKGRISFQLVEAELEKMTEKGGRYFQGMLKQSKTFAGAMSNFKGVIDATAVSFGNFLMNEMGLKDGLVELTAWLDKARVKFQNWIKENPKLFKWLVIIAAVIAALGPALMILGSAIVFAGTASLAASYAVSFLVGAFTALSAVIAFFLSPIGLVILAVAALAGAAYLIYEYWEPIKLFFINLWNDIITIFNKAKKMLGFKGDTPLIDVGGKGKNAGGGWADDKEIKITEKKKTEETKKIKTIYDTPSGGDGTGKKDYWEYIGSPVDLANKAAEKKSMSEMLKATIAVKDKKEKDKSEIRIVMDLPEGFKAVAKNKKDGKYTDVIFDMNYKFDTGYLNPAFMGK